MISVERQLPRNSRISAAVSPAAIIASWNTPEMAALTKTDWSNSGRTSIPTGSSFSARGSMALRLSTMRRVEALPVLSSDSRAPRSPLMRTILVWGEKPSRTWATSRR